MFFQPSHIVFVLSSDGIVQPWKHYYGYFYDENNNENHQSEFTDSIFDNIRIEGDVTIDLFKVRSGGPFTNPSEIPKEVVFKPYKDRRMVALTEDGNRNFKLYNDSTHNYWGYFDGRVIKPETDFELLVRGKMGKDDEFKFVVKYDNYVSLHSKLLTIEGTFTGINTCSRLKVGGWTKNTTPSKEFSLIDPLYQKLDKYQETYQAYHEKYTSNPFKKNTAFEIAVRRLNYTTTNKKSQEEFHSYPRNTWQLTIRVECRIYTWYFYVYPNCQIDTFLYEGDVKIHQAVIIH